MNWVLCRRKGAERSEDWLRHFDVVVVGCNKPRFFSERSNLFEIHLPTGMLQNTEGGSPMIPLDEADLPTPILVSVRGGACGAVLLGSAAERRLHLAACHLSHHAVLCLCTLPHHHRHHRAAGKLRAQLPAWGRGAGGGAGPCLPGRVLRRPAQE